MTVALRSLAPADHDRLLAMAIAFNDEDNHPLTPGGRRALAQIEGVHRSRDPVPPAVTL